LITVDQHSTMRDVLAVLQKNNVLSVPVVNYQTKEFYGLVDVLDIAGYVLDTWKKNSIHMEDLHFPSSGFFSAPVLDVLNFSGIDNPFFIDEGKSLADLITLFRHPKNYSRLHRAAVTREGSVVDIISQSDVVSFTAFKIHEFPVEKANTTIGMLQGLIRSPLMIRIDSSFVDALERLYKNRISGLALVDHEFKLSGNLSASDLRGMNPTAFDFFTGSIFQFLAKAITGWAKPTLSVGPGNTFADVIKTLADERVHRLYITDQMGHPLGLISLIDVISRL